MKIPVSVIILTMNEACNITRCINSLADFDDIIVLDSGSTDGTLQILDEQFPDARVFHRAFTDFGDQRNYAIEHCNCRNEWILFVDADEFMEPQLASEIDALVKAPGETVGGFIAGRNYFLGRWLKRTTFYPSYQLRLLKRGSVIYRREGHGQREVTDGKTNYLKNTWYHDCFSQGIAQWIDRHNRYSTAEVELMHRLRHEPLSILELLSVDPIKRRRCLKRLASRVGFRPVTRFLYTYFWRLGFLDGHPGFLFCLLKMTNDIHISAKSKERVYRENLQSKLLSK